MHLHERMTAPDHACDQLVDEGILRPTQRREVELGGVQKRARIDAAGMRRIEHDRRAALGRLHDLEWRVELYFHRHRHRNSGAFLKMAPPYSYISMRARLCQDRVAVHPIFTAYAAN